MKKAVIPFAIMAALSFIAVTGAPASAHGHAEISGSIWIGPAWGWGAPYPYYSPYYGPPVYYEPPVIIQRQAPAYDDSQPAPPTQDQQYYWYFCPDSNNYYPYVKQCPGGWKKVLPKPPKGGE